LYFNDIGREFGLKNSRKFFSRLIFVGVKFMREEIFVKGETKQLLLERERERERERTKKILYMNEGSCS
jgi:hypothetical protein